MKVPPIEMDVAKPPAKAEEIGDMIVRRANREVNTLPCMSPGILARIRPVIGTSTIVCKTPIMRLSASAKKSSVLKPIPTITSPCAISPAYNILPT